MGLSIGIDDQLVAFGYAEPFSAPPAKALDRTGLFWIYGASGAATEQCAGVGPEYFRPPGSNVMPREARERSLVADARAADLAPIVDSIRASGVATCWRNCWVDLDQVVATVALYGRC